MRVETGAIFYFFPLHDSQESFIVEQNEEEEKANPALDSSPSSWVRSNPQFNAGEVSRARLYAETLVSLDFNRSQVSVSRWQRRPAPELSPPCRRLQPREVAWSHSNWAPLRSTRSPCSFP